MTPRKFFTKNITMSTRKPHERRLPLWERIQNLEEPQRAEPEIITLDMKAVDRQIAELEELWNQAFVFDREANWLTINLEYPYEIDLKRIQDLSSLVGWNLHLLEKEWFTGSASRQFIERVAAFKGFKIRRGT